MRGAALSVVLAACGASQEAPFHITVATLTDVFDTHPVVQDGIAFLNADVEGFEKQVFSGLDFTRYRPHVILAESTAPLTELPTHQV